MERINKGFEHLAKALESGDCPENLSLIFDYIQMNPKHMRHLANALQSNACPKNLTLSLREVETAHYRGSKPILDRKVTEDSFIKIITNALSEGRYPEGLTLNISGSLVGEAGATALAEKVLKNEKCQRTINLKMLATCDFTRIYVEIIDENGVNIIAEAMSINTSVLSLMIDGEGWYDLALMSGNELRANIIEFICEEEGLRYRVRRGPYNSDEITDLIIPWNELPENFPKNDGDVLANKDKLLPEILKVTSKKGGPTHNKKTYEDEEERLNKKFIQLFCLRNRLLDEYKEQPDIISFIRTCSKTAGFCLPILTGQTVPALRYLALFKAKAIEKIEFHKDFLKFHKDFLKFLPENLCDFWKQVDKINELLTLPLKKLCDAPTAVSMQDSIFQNQEDYTTAIIEEQPPTKKPKK